MLPITGYEMKEKIEYICSYHNSDISDAIKLLDGIIPDGTLHVYATNLWVAKDFTDTLCYKRSRRLNFIDTDEKIRGIDNFHIVMLGTERKPTPQQIENRRRFVSVARSRRGIVLWSIRYWR